MKSFTGIKGRVSLFIVFALGCAWCLATGVAAQEKAKNARSIAAFDKDWRFFSGDAADAEKNAFDDAAWRKLDVPHDWSIEGEFAEQNKTGKGGGYLPSGVAWYRKHFAAAEKDKTRRVYIEFDGVMETSDVWINGVHLGTRPSGYISFAYDLTPHIKFGAENVIAVRADNSRQPSSRWYTGAGIYRRVRLVIKDAVNIPQWGTFVSTPQVSAEAATVRVNSEVVNNSNAPRRVSLLVTLTDSGGKIVGTAETAPQTVPPAQTVNFQTEIPVRNPRLWHVANGVLYKAAAKIRDGKKTVDDETVSFGIRDFKFEAKTGFWLNNQNFKINGVCLHHDASAFGAAVPLAVWERRFAELRKLGVNAIRTAHNPPAPEFLDLADRMGFLIMDELFDQWTIAKNPYDYHLFFKEWSRRDVRDTVRRDRNHPSVIIYSAGNEIRDTPKPEIAIPILKGLIETFHANDPTRPVTQGLFRPNVSKDYENGLADLLDVVGQNYREKEILAAHRQKPTRKILGTENSHDLNQWLALRDNPEYAGQFIWSGIDYLGESPGFPMIAENFGLLFRSATPRPRAFQRQSWWSDKPMVYIARRNAPTPLAPTDPGYGLDRHPQVLFSDWTPQNLEKHEENVEIYSNCETVELFLNGKSLGEKTKPADDSPRNWKVDFEAGAIRAVGKNGGRAVAEYELKTAGKPAKILLAVDKNKIVNDWDDVAFVTATVVDANGVVVPHADHSIEFKVIGNGFVAAVDSDDNRSLESFRGNRRRAWQGTCFALIKANKSNGRITISAEAGNLRSNVLTISAGR
jgi:beta-galactosidase